MMHPYLNLLDVPQPAAQPAPVTPGKVRKPPYLRYNPQGIPEAIRAHPHWLVCGPDGRPVARPGVGNSKTNPEDWTDFATVSRIAEAEKGLWPYIVLTDETAFTVFDVDCKPRTRTTEKTESEDDYSERIGRAGRAHDRLREFFPVRYESRSKSGNGRHIIVTGKFTGTGGKGKGDWTEVEIYTRGHGIALTGHVMGEHGNPAAYPAETLQGIRDTIKRESPASGSGDDMPDRRSNGRVPPDFAREIMAELARLHGRPDRDDWRDMASAVCDGVGTAAAIELLQEFFPEEERGEYKKLIKSFQWLAPWGSLNKFLKGSSMKAGDWFDGVTVMPDLSKDDPAADPPAVEPFAIVRAGDMEGTAEAPDFVEGLLTEGGASVVYGPSNCGKTFLVLSLAASVATGAPFRGNMAVDQGAVIYVALEGTRGARNRIEALKREGILPPDAPLFLCFAPVSLLARGHAAKLAASVKLAAEQSGLPCRLVILDTLARAMAGGDENSGKDMGNVVKAIDAVRAATGAHVCVVHHCGKDMAKGARGWSGLRAAVDTEIEISRPEGETISTMWATKQRDLSPGEAMPFSLKQVTLGTDRRGKPITSCVVRHEDETMAGKPGKSGRKATCTPEEMLRYLPAATVKEWRERVKEETGLGATQFYTHKKKLEKDRKIRREPGTNRMLHNDPCDAMPDLME